MAKKKDRQWIKAHIDDPYVQMAKKAGYRSRAAFKLLEIQERGQLIGSGDAVLDCGAAPGGWSDLVRRWVGPQGRVVAVDLLPMEPVVGVDFIQGDFTQSAIIEQIKVQAPEGFHVVISDMAPNLSGHKSIDQLTSMGLSEDVLGLLPALLKPAGHFVIKLFHGEGFDDYVRQVRQVFDKVSIRKPKASKDKSREVYLVAKGYSKS